MWGDAVFLFSFLSWLMLCGIFLYTYYPFVNFLWKNISSSLLHMYLCIIYFLQYWGLNSGLLNVCSTMWVMPPVPPCAFLHSSSLLVFNFFLFSCQNSMHVVDSKPLCEQLSFPFHRLPFHSGDGLVTVQNILVWCNVNGLHKGILFIQKRKKCKHILLHGWNLRKVCWEE
jgi:hypothetical protein